jgi:hypothetical protein
MFGIYYEKLRSFVSFILIFCVCMWPTSWFHQLVHFFAFNFVNMFEGMRTLLLEVKMLVYETLICVTWANRSYRFVCPHKQYGRHTPFVSRIWPCTIPCPLTKYSYFAIKSNIYDSTIFACALCLTDLHHIVSGSRSYPHRNLTHLFICLFIRTNTALGQVKQLLKQKSCVPWQTILQDLHTFN